jgi:hypothetical protein
MHKIIHLNTLCSHSRDRCVCPGVSITCYSKSTWAKLKNFSRIIDQECWSSCEVVDLGFACGFFQFCYSYYSYCPWLSKNLHYSICVARRTNVFNQESRTSTGMLFSMCSCASWWLLVDVGNIWIVIALDLVKNCNFNLRKAKNICLRVVKV